MSSIVHLDQASVEAIARRTAELLRGDGPAAGLLAAAEIARRFGVSRDFVYSHAAELGAIRLGDGKRPRLRFDPIIVAERLAPDPPAEAERPRRARPRRGGQSSRIELLPVRGGHEGKA